MNRYLIFLSVIAQELEIMENIHTVESVSF